ncbi:adenosylmethionine--8-amino-7-oxononanoate transaminase [Craterilacuibacter sp. RT1T]|uniref:adenosylmethionine--8-amino-7-oxononanoate transaminase n=1 Tax=Craterilacuibacter sp. RT1T TaxID=2942211 RepID=UPI0020C11023|nr:adenosylmethionine--8-amino-7-oxononanoate transaminase [Craterilacuibacter sp. RT1T]MCL6263955.1 adenosylmethionine--8-amino-7-oxononanoate transaminase [Craterilacuibacter sp. RT1T]
MSRNQEWLIRSRAAVWHPCTQMKRHETLPIVPIARGDGAYLVDFDGQRYLDGVSSWWVNLFGHNETRIKAAIRCQLDELDHVMLAGFTHRPVVELSERLSALTGLGHAFYASDGASATEIALKMSFHYWKNQGRAQKQRFVSLENSYHGETVGALAVTDVPLFSATYAPLVKNGWRVPSPDARGARDGESARDVALRAAASLENLLAKHHGEIAALIVEPLVQGAAGMAMYDAAYLTRARALCDQYQIHLIADEIAVGFGRTGTLFACEQAGIRPDFLCLSKGITGGTLPLSCVLSSDEIYQAFYHDDVTRGFLHSHSYTGNALACSAALAVLDIFEQDQVLARNREQALRFDVLLAPLQQHPRVRNWRRCGMIWAFEVDSARADFAQAFFAAMLKLGCLLRPIGKTVYFMPPYVVNEADMALLRDATLATLDALEQGASVGAAQTALP